MARLAVTSFTISENFGTNSVIMNSTVNTRTQCDVEILMC